MKRLKGFRLFFALFTTAILLFLGGCGGQSYRYYKATWLGRLQPGMSKDAVKGLLGEPTGVERREVPPNELREVWIYHVKDLNPLQSHLYPKIQLIVFSDGKMVAKNPGNPWATPLIVPSPKGSVEGK